MSLETPGFWERLRALAALFLRLGVVGFGGPLAHVGLMEDQCVTRRQWATRQQFLEGLAICNLLPGPTSTQLSIYLGYLRAGMLGGLVSGACFIFPAFLLVLALAWVYIQFGALPQVGALFLAIGPVVIGIIVNTLYRTGKTALTNVSTWVIALIACALVTLPLLPPSVNLLTILLIAGLAGALLYTRSFRNQAAKQQEAVASPPPEAPKADSTIKSVIAAPLLGAKAVVAAAAPSAGILTLGLVFFKIGLLMFGGGLVVAPLLQQELVDGQHWLTTRQLLDGLALGQLTPGPVTTVATFAGYTVAGFPGGVVATIAVFAPSFILVLSLTPLLLRVRNAPIAKAFLKGITAGALGAIAAAAILFGRAAIIDPITALIALVSLALLLRWNVNTVFLIGGAAAIGLGRALLHI